MKNKTIRQRTPRRPTQQPTGRMLPTHAAQRRLYTDFLALAFYPGMGGEPLGTIPARLDN
ncbi:hypothetical protein ESB00_04495 [Oleiharenicola lentus]|uniref:Uncharacterized protein n=1 Tax=Oleiharenicola lentus TaxID=2508720 RepID=A0A4Q1C8L8_9BACT|nr:hypothetical protein [Oleiharenicola lentus]RXK55162.1 hypothetical protein ESB00_04495 [Oleiharenicola lentus]